METNYFKLRPIFFVSQNEKNKQRAINFFEEDLKAYHKLAKSNNTNEIELITTGINILIEKEDITDCGLHTDYNTKTIQVATSNYSISDFAPEVVCIQIFMPAITLTNKCVKLASRIAKSTLQSQLIHFTDWPVEVKESINTYYHKLTEKLIDKLYHQIAYELQLDAAKNIEVKDAIQI